MSAMSHTLSQMNTAAMNSAMSTAMNMFSHYNHQEYILQELTPLIKPNKEPVHPNTQQQNNMPHECQTCHRRFAQKQTLIQHTTTHTGIKAFQCQLCFKNFTQQGSLQRHMAIHNDERPYACEVCHKAFRQKSHLTNHAKSHVDNRMYKCTLCTKSFNRSDHCKRHMLTHSTNRPIYTCFFCNKEFKEKYLMKTHIKKKLCFHEATRTRRPKDGNEPPKERLKRVKFLFQCEHCYKNFHRSTKEFDNKYLEKYCKNCCPVTEQEKFSFFEEEVYICTVCNGPPFNKLKTYNRHMALHSEDRKFECEYCHLRFQKKYLLRYHLNIHNNVKDYQCQLCGLQFETMIKLRDHYCVHVEHAEYLATIMKIYQCHHCSKLFVRRTNCVKHVRSHMNLPRRPKGPRPKVEENEDEEDIAKPNANRVILPTDSSAINSGNRVDNVNQYDHFLSKSNMSGSNPVSSGNALLPSVNDEDDDNDDDHYMGDDHHDDYDEDSTPVTSQPKPAQHSNTQNNFNNGNYYQQFNNFYCNKPVAGETNITNQNMFQNNYNQSSSQNYGFDGMLMNQNNQVSSAASNNSNANLAVNNAHPIQFPTTAQNNIQVYGPVEIEHPDIADLEITSKPRDDDNNPAPFHCYVCKKKYRHKKQLVRHFQVNHTNDYDKVICDICHKEFTHKSSLVEHKLLHLPPKFKCPVCQKMFNRKYSLKRHMLLHKGIRPFNCNRCPASFNHKKSLEIHLLKHEGILPYECNICNKRYVDKGTLSRHYLVHSGERKFVCHLCDLRFSQKIHLSKHYLTHDEIEKKLILDCPVCEKKFYTKFNFGRHLETHNKKRGVHCETCNRTFSFENGYQRHLEKGKCNPKGTVKTTTKRRRKKHMSDDDSSDEPTPRRSKRQKKTKKKKRKKRKKVVVESSDGEDDSLPEEEEEEEEDEEDAYELPLEIKTELNPDEDVKNIQHINPDYSENFDSEVEELSMKHLKKEKFTAQVKNEQISNQLSDQLTSQQTVMINNQFARQQFNSQSISNEFTNDQYIAPVISTEQFGLSESFASTVEQFPRQSLTSDHFAVPQLNNWTG